MGTCDTYSLSSTEKTRGKRLGRYHKKHFSGSIDGNNAIGPNLPNENVGFQYYKTITHYALMVRGNRVN